MRLRVWIAGLAAIVMAFCAAAFAGDNTAPAKTKSQNDLKNQTVCPVMGNKIDSTVYTDIQGQRVYHCCPGCGAKLKADPDKYFKKSAAEGVLFENIQTLCPVTGEELEDKAFFTDFEGRRVYFCCNKCKATFAKDARKYLKKMDEQMPKSKPENDDQKQESHEGHNHG